MNHCLSNAFEMCYALYVVNQGKTEICVFHNKDPPTITVKVENVNVKSINVLGVTFGCKLNWNEQISNCIGKAKRVLFALRLLRKYFNLQEMRSLLNSYFYSVLYYNYVIWLTPQINSAMQQICPKELFNLK